MKLKLIYFDFPFWRAEMCRLALFMGGIEFEDYRIQRDEFIKLKADGAFPFDQLPVLEVDGQFIAQSGTIGRFCGKLSGLYPKGEDLEEAKVDMILEACSEINYKISPTMREKDETRKVSMRKNLAEKTIPAWLGNMEKLLKENSESGYFCKNLTVADLAFWRILGWLKGGIIDHIPKTVAQAFPTVLEHFEMIDKQPKVRQWMESKYPDR